MTATAPKIPASATKPGALIAWTHHFPADSGREPLTRTGIGWSEAPSVEGSSRVAWVVPDEPLASDAHSALAVAFATTGKTYAHAGAVWGHFHASGPLIPRGEAYSSNQANSPTGGLATAAARHARQPRIDNATRIAA